MNQKLELLREEKDLTQKDLAKLLGVVPSVYNEWENNKLNIPTKRLYEIAEFYHINIDYLVGLSNTKVSLYTNKNIDITQVSSNLKEIRNNLNLSMRELAKKLNTTSSAISNYENSKNLILSSFLIELCSLSNYSIDYVLGRSNSKYLK